MSAAKWSRVLALLVVGGALTLSGSVAQASAPTQAAAPPAAAPATAQPALQDVSCAGPGTCVVAGGTALLTNPPVAPYAAIWRSGTWRSLKAPAYSTSPKWRDRFTGLSCPRATWCALTASRDSGAGYAGNAVSRWASGAWTTEVAPAAQPCNATDSTCHVVGTPSCPSTSFCVAVGHEDGTTSHLWKWNGARWSQAALPVTPADLTAVSCSSARFCVAVGSHEYAGRTADLVEMWHGGRWRVTQPSNAASVLSSVSCVSSSFCVALGSGEQTLVWNGTTWRAVSLGVARVTTERVSCAAVEACMAVGRYGGGNGGRALLFNGRAWKLSHTEKVSASHYGDWTSVSCAKTTTLSCMAVGMSGLSDASVVYRYDAGSWRKIAAPPLS